MKYLRIAGQFAVIVALFLAVSSFANWPTYRQFPQGSTVVLLTFVHSADRKAECRQLTAQEIEKLPPNMRRVQSCPRNRRPIYVEMDLGGRPIFRKNLPPSGIASDGPSRVYQRFIVPAGKYEVAVRMRDTPRTEGFDHMRTDTVTLVPDQTFVVDYSSERSDFVFH
ncbi:MAG: hypothetical protein EPO23_14870 [Xanthobacteraceae bacterium]|nr:MAG: hypothetical protein EPO23_14870 [Xanthobacteraceae bacterium]